MEINPNRFAAAIDEIVASEVRAEIARQKTKQKYLADKLGLHPNIIGRKVRGEVAFTVPELCAVAIALGIDPTVILNRALADENVKAAA